MAGTAGGLRAAVAGFANPIGTRTPAPQRAARSSQRAGSSITNNFTINEVGSGEATARRVITRMARTAAAL